VAGRYQPLADGDTLLPCRPTMPAFCSRFRKRSEAGRFGSASLRSL